MFRSDSEKNETASWERFLALRIGEGAGRAKQVVGGQGKETP